MFRVGRYYCLANCLNSDSPGLESHFFFFCFRSVKFVNGRLTRNRADWKTHNAQGSPGVPPPIIIQLSLGRANNDADNDYNIVVRHIRRVYGNTLTVVVFFLCFFEMKIILWRNNGCRTRGRKYTYTSKIERNADPKVSIRTGLNWIYYIYIYINI